MKILPGRRVVGFAGAATLALHDAGEDDMALDIARLFTPALDLDKLRAEADRSINVSVRGRYRPKATWSGRQWFVPVPNPSYSSSPIPMMSFAVSAYLVASITIATPGYSSRMATVMGPLNRREKLILPISFLQAVLDEELGQFEVASRDGTHTGWIVPGFKEPVQLANDFVTQLSQMLSPPKTVAAWVLDFGAAGKTIALDVVGSLLGLQFHDLITPVPAGEQRYRQEVVIGELTQMFGSAVAAEMFEQAAPHLKADMTNDEALTMILKEHGRRFVKNGS